MDEIIKLTPKQEAFCVHYTTNGAETFSNGTKSAITAGYSETSAYSQASALLKNPKIQERIQELYKDNMTRNMITSLGAKVRDVAITELKDNVFYASIYLLSPSGDIIEIDSRPSDAIAVAMRCDVPVRVRESVIEKSKVIDLASDNAINSNKDELTDILENLSLEDFGKYKM